LILCNHSNKTCGLEFKNAKKKKKQNKTKTKKNQCLQMYLSDEWWSFWGAEFLTEGAVNVYMSIYSLQSSEGQGWKA
jgi:hypothetical protein